MKTEARFVLPSCPFVQTSGSATEFHLPPQLTKSIHNRFQR